MKLSRFVPSSEVKLILYWKIEPIILFVLDLASFKLAGMPGGSQLNMPVASVRLLADCLQTNSLY